MLTEEEYAEVKAGEERALLMKQETTRLRASCGVETTGKEEAGFYILMAHGARQVSANCAEQLGLARRAIRNHRCKAHKSRRLQNTDPRAYL